MFVTVSHFRTGNVVASFSSKMFKQVEGRRQSFALILLKKLGFVVGVKSLVKRIFDVVIVINTKMRKRKYRPMLIGLTRAGLCFRALSQISKRAHNGCRGKSRRRV